jgi:hypothetical protein
MYRNGVPILAVLTGKGMVKEIREETESCNPGYRAGSGSR